MPSISSRRKFLQKISAAGLAVSAGSFQLARAQPPMIEKLIPERKRISANDHIRIALIGTGIMGHADLTTALKIPGIELAAACDLYTGRLTRMREQYGNNIVTTRDYREILERKDIDAVIIATADHWHSRISIDAMNKNKHVYCEKPMVKEIKQGFPVIQAAERTKKIIQIGSQGISGLVHIKAKELYEAGEIGKLNFIEASCDRHSALGAWQYTMPTDMSTETVDWDRYIAGMPKQPFDPKKFFWWRNYRQFGTGASGDMFVHLLTSIHMITGSKGPSRIFSSGQLSQWKDGRDVPDVMTAIMDYPESPEHPAFQVSLRINFSSGAGEKFLMRFIGDEGVMDLGNDVTITHDLLSRAPGMAEWEALSTYPKEMQQVLLEEYKKKYSKEDQEKLTKEPIRYVMPPNHDEHVEHFKNFFDAVRGGNKVLEDAVFGFRAAAPCLACNESYFNKEIVKWDPVKMKLN